MKYQMAMDTASKGDFIRNTPEISFIHLRVLKIKGTSKTMPVMVKWDSILNPETLVQWINLILCSGK